MPAIDTADGRLLDALSDVFQRHGYEGASLSLLSQATGLQRASLYHRFPGGKQEMANAVLGRAVAWLQEHALTPLSGDGPPEERVRTMVKRLEQFYDRGNRSCLLDTLSLGQRNGPFSKEVQAATRTWINAMAGVAREAGLPSDLAKRRAEEAIVAIQGGLVVARATGDATAFRRAIQPLPGRLTVR